MSSAPVTGTLAVDSTWIPTGLVGSSTVVLDARCGRTVVDTPGAMSTSPVQNARSTERASLLVSAAAARASHSASDMPNGEHSTAAKTVNGSAPIVATPVSVAVLLAGSGSGVGQGSRVTFAAAHESGWY